MRSGTGYFSLDVGTFYSLGLDFDSISVGLHSGMRRML